MFDRAERNAGRPRGRLVLAGDITAHALAGHAACGGRGQVNGVACSCATKRFLRAHPEVIVVREGAAMVAYWPAAVSLDVEEVDHAAEE